MTRASRIGTVCFVALIVALSGATAVQGVAAQQSGADATDAASFDAASSAAQAGGVSGPPVRVAAKLETQANSSQANGSQANESQANGSQANGTQANGSQATVSFVNQSTNETVVVVDTLVVPSGGFVAVHNESLLDGDAVGSVVGVSEYLRPGFHESVEIRLFNVSGAEFNRSELRENQTLIAMPHLDTNDNETYDFVATNGTVDGPYTENGSAVTDSATVGPEPTEANVSFVNQSSNGTVVVVDTLVVSAGGFVAVHNESLLDGDAVGSVVGVSEYLRPGFHESVEVRLFNVSGAEFDRSELRENRTLIAMPHLDTNDNETYDFVATNGTVDGPYTENGSAVTDSATVAVEQPAEAGNETGNVSDDGPAAIAAH